MVDLGHGQQTPGGLVELVELVERVRESSTNRSSGDITSDTPIYKNTIRVRELAQVAAKTRKRIGGTSTSSTNGDAFSKANRTDREARP